MIDLAFWIIAILVVASAITVVVLRDVFRAALMLVACFFCVAALYITLNADFLAAVQVLVYAGAIGVLILFAVMLTRNLRQGSPFNRTNGPALLLSALVLAAIVGVVVTTDWATVASVSEVVEMPLGESTTSHIAGALFDQDGGFVLPFEIASVLLLAALIGAVVLVSRKDKD